VDETFYVHGVEIDDRISIATPEGVDLELTLAGVGSRFVSALVDFMLQIVLLVGVSGIGAAAGAFGSGYGSVVVFLAGFLVFAAYDVLFEVFASGRTPGKNLNGLRVVRVDGSPVTFFTSAIRNVLRLVDILPGLYLVGIVTILVTRQNQRLGDVAAGTLVVRERTQQPSLRELHVAQPQPQPAPAGNSWDVTGVTADELVAVRSFLARRYELTHEARYRLAADLAGALRPKVVGAPENLGSEAFLEKLAVAKQPRA
jgi:uncharacterized RDD family membrane protein YckC